MAWGLAVGVLTRNPARTHSRRFPAFLVSGCLHFLLRSQPYPEQKRNKGLQHAEERLIPKDSGGENNLHEMSCPWLRRVTRIPSCPIRLRLHLGRNGIKRILSPAYARQQGLHHAAQGPRGTHCVCFSLGYEQVPASSLHDQIPHDRLWPRNGSSTHELPPGIRAAHAAQNQYLCIRILGLMKGSQ